MLEVIQTGFEGLWILQPKVHSDERGYFFESFNLQQFLIKTKMKIGFIPDKEATSNKGIIRGLHFQHAPFAQSKLVRVIKGKVKDVVVDLRKDSATFGQVFHIILSGNNKKQLFIPKGFAHGYSVLEDETIFAYKCDAFYNAESEGGIRYDDPELNIDWELGEGQGLISSKDKSWPFLKDLDQVF
jgi:dTDP-4-dehydrorhamnose 3,5-epimerase